MIDLIKKEFNQFLDTNLNEPQRAAVLQEKEGLLVIAGAGSGKTRVITSRIANLVINQGVEPRSIVALTFTNKAAGEMKERLMHTFQSHYRLPFIGTFHSYCLLLLRTNPTLLPSSQFSILDSDDQLDLIKKIIKKYALAKHITASQIVHQISNFKNKSYTPETKEELMFTPMLKEIYLEYESEKSRSHCLDFDDLILQVLNCLRTNISFKQQFQRSIRHIMVDEYQDTSHVQHQLLQEMGLKDGKLYLDSLCAVGDEDQSIYSWRGATVANMLKFQQDFAPVRVVKIEQNYRSAQPILQAANDVIAHNRMRNPKNLWSTKDATNRLLQVMCTSGDQEAGFIATIIKIAKKKKSLADIAILYRTHFQSRTIEEALIHHAIPYRIVGGIRFYERKEVKDLLAYLRLIINPYDKVSLLRIINTPARGLGQKFEELLIDTWNRNPLFDSLQLLNYMLSDPEAGLTGNKRQAVTSFVEMFAKLPRDYKPSDLLDQVIDGIGYISYLNSSYDTQEAQTKVENVQEFLQAIMVFERKQDEIAAADPELIQPNLLETFLYEVSLLQEKVEDHNSDEFVQMMTLHAAKGLEFDTVILAGLEEGLLPSSRSLNASEALEEERRLMYVGMTRAKEHLILCHAYSRITFGQITDQAASRFLGEIPRKIIQELDLNAIHPSRAALFVEQWLNGSVSAPLLSPTRPAATKIVAKPTAPKPSDWAKNQAVMHQTFGTGIIVQVEKADDNEYYITALFSSGKKKLSSKFLQKR